MIKCDTCGAFFGPVRGSRKRCNGPDCQREYWRLKSQRQYAAKHNHLWADIECAMCGIHFDAGPPRQAKIPKHCPTCKPLHDRHLTPKQTLTCEICTKPFTASRSDSKCCSANCTKINKRISDRKLKRQRLLAGLCARHGTPGQCEICHARNFNKNNKRRGPQGERAPALSKADKRKLCEQQKWKCSLCGKKLNSKLRSTHNMGVTIDHVIPVSKGGTGDLANLNAAHRICNIKKGNRSLGPEQLRIFG